MDAVAERRLELRVEKGIIEVIACLGNPKNVGNDEWTCACITRFATEERSIDIHGGDSMQALQLAMATLDVELQHGAKVRGGTLYYFDEPFISIFQDSGMQHRRGNTDPRSEPECADSNETFPTVNLGSAVVPERASVLRLGFERGAKVEPLSNDDGERPPVGVIVTLRDFGGGKSRVTLDDVKSESTRRETRWTFDLFYTHKDLDTAAVDSMKLPSSEYEGLGAAIMARLLALSGRVS